MKLDNAVLVLVDFQQAFDAPPWPRRFNQAVDANGAAVLAAFRQAQLPVIHVRHDSIEPDSTLRPDRPGNALRNWATPLDGELVIAKAVNSAFIGTNLDLHLRRMAARRVIICGISTDMCVSTTVRVGANLGWSMVVVGDACDCFDLPDRRGGVIPAETVHDVHLATLAFEFCEIVDTSSVVAAADQISRSGA